MNNQWKKVENDEIRRILEFQIKLLIYSQNKAFFSEPHSFSIQDFQTYTSRFSSFRALTLIICPKPDPKI